MYELHCNSNSEVAGQVIMLPIVKLYGSAYGHERPFCRDWLVQHPPPLSSVAMHRDLAQICSSLL